MQSQKSPTKHANSPSQENMETLLRSSGIRLKPQQLEQLWRYHNLLRRRNQDMELTRLVGFNSIVVKHYVDCMIVGNFLRLPSPLLDLGTGAGFPGIPLKIRYPELQIILAEPRPKRITFLKEACSVIPLSNVDVFEHKVVSRSFQRPVLGVITRAVETIDKTLLRTSACLGQGGLVIFMKGPNAGKEIKDAERRFHRTHRVFLDQPYRLPGTTHERRLIVFERLIPPVIPEV